jgi:hypothetical protein
MRGTLPKISPVAGLLHSSLTKPGHVAVAKNSPDPLNKPVLAAIALDVLCCQVADQRLSNRKTHRLIHKFVHLSLDIRTTHLLHASPFSSS